MRTHHRLRSISAAATLMRLVARSAALLALVALVPILSVGDRATAMPSIAQDAPPSTPAKAGEPEFPRSWFSGDDRTRRRHDAMIGKRAPALRISRWVGEPQKLTDLRGKVVVIDFWATWCPPCMRAIPVNKQLLEEYGEKGLVIVAIHDHRRGLERLEEVINTHKISYPVGVDNAGHSARAWGLAFWPTYGVIDREGNVRAVGLNSNRVGDVVKKLIAEPIADDLKPKADDEKAGDDKTKDRTAAPTDTSTITYASRLPDEWTERLDGQRAQVEALLDAPAPPLPDGPWLNGSPTQWSGLRGNVVLLDFWATWCAPCVAAIPRLNELQRRHADRGLVVIGVCHGRGAERMAEAVHRYGIRYPVVADSELKTIRAYRVDTYPDYYLVDRKGNVRGVDLRTEHLDSAIEVLLSE